MEKIIPDSNKLNIEKLDQIPTLEEIKEKMKETIYHCGVKLKKELTQTFLKSFKE
jgi:hypothetical protein